MKTGKDKSPESHNYARKTEKGVFDPELDLHAMTVDEAIPLVQEYIDNASRSGLSEVRIVHGKGTGILRQAVMRELKKHPLVKSYRAGGRFEGSTGATVVHL
ncbi:MAG: Smr/MutS family protein [Dehalococcoidia bacterium]|nr:Smr/MutS family protein [Dehalococcoidia bacterium]